MNQEIDDILNQEIVRECADFLMDELDDHFAAEQLIEHFRIDP